MRGSEFIFDSVDALYYDLNKVSLSRGESYIDSHLNCENRVIILMITDGKKWHYLAVQSLSALFR